MEFKLSKEEREFQLLGNEASDSWDFWTHSERWAKKLSRLGYKVERDHQGGWSCRIPLGRVRILKAEKRKATGRPFQSKTDAIPHETGDQNSTGIGKYGESDERHKQDQAM